MTTTDSDSRPGDALPEPTRQRLLEAAEEIFADRGFAGASVREICRRADANIAAVNYHFGDKERLYSEAVKFAHRNCAEGVEFPDWVEGTEPSQKLRDFVRAVMGRMLEIPRPSSVRLMTREMTEPTPAGAEAVEAYIRPMAECLYAIVSELLPDAPHSRRIMVGFSIIGQCLFYRQNRTIGLTLFGDDFRSLDAAGLADHITSFTMAALGYGPSLKGDRS